VINQFAFQEIDAGGEAKDTTIHAHGWQYVNGGDATKTIIDGGLQIVGNGGQSWWTNMFGGTENVTNGGIAQDTEVNGASYSSPGYLEIGTGGSSYFATIDRYGVEDVYGYDADAYVAGQQFVWSGGNTFNVSLDSGGSQSVEAGGLSDHTKIGGSATEWVAAGGIAHAAVFGGPNAMLCVADDSCVTGSMFGFKATDQIDFRNIAFDPGATLSFVENGANTGGILTITNGATVEHLNFLGQYTTANFSLSNLAGSTLVTGH
jgi:autotransporter passenger strand-loop-strand repeat protein